MYEKIMSFSDAEMHQLSTASRRMVSQSEIYGKMISVGSSTRCHETYGCDELIYIAPVRGWKDGNYVIVMLAVAVVVGYLASRVGAGMEWIIGGCRDHTEMDFSVVMALIQQIQFVTTICHALMKMQFW